jgi:hypothetical protein
MIPDVATDVDRLTDLALALPPAEREMLAHRIWESLEPSESVHLAQRQPSPSEEKP